MQTMWVAIAILGVFALGLELDVRGIRLIKLWPQLAAGYRTWRRGRTARHLERAQSRVLAHQLHLSNGWHCGCGCCARRTGP